MIIVAGDREDTRKEELTNADEDVIPDLIEEEVNVLANERGTKLSNQHLEEIGYYLFALELDFAIMNLMECKL